MFNISEYNYDEVIKNASAQSESYTIMNANWEKSSITKHNWLLEVFAGFIFLGFLLW